MSPCLGTRQPRGTARRRQSRRGCLLAGLPCLCELGSGTGQLGECPGQLGVGALGAGPQLGAGVVEGGDLGLVGLAELVAFARGVGAVQLGLPVAADVGRGPVPRRRTPRPAGRGQCPVRQREHGLRPRRPDDGPLRWRGPGLARRRAPAGSLPARPGLSLPGRTRVRPGLPGRRQLSRRAQRTAAHRPQPRRCGPRRLRLRPAGGADRRGPPRRGRRRSARRPRPGPPRSARPPASGSAARSSWAASSASLPVRAAMSARMPARSSAARAVAIVTGRSRSAGSAGAPA